MIVHLLKMCVGIDSIDHLRRRQAERLEAQRAAGQAAKLCHWTRNMPRRAAEIEGEGSIYWIIRVRIRARQLIVSLERDDDANAIKRCAVVLNPEVVETEARRARPMQGWRYLEANDAPADLGRPVVDHEYEMPTQMITELRELGLI